MYTMLPKSRLNEKLAGTHQAPIARSQYILYGADSTNTLLFVMIRLKVVLDGIVVNPPTFLRDRPIFLRVNH